MEYIPAETQFSYTTKGDSSNGDEFRISKVAVQNGRKVTAKVNFEEVNAISWHRMRTYARLRSRSSSGGLVLPDTKKARESPSLLTPIQTMTLNGATRACRSERILRLAVDRSILRSPSRAHSTSRCSSPAPSFHSPAPPPRDPADRTR